MSQTKETKKAVEADSGHGPAAAGDSDILGTLLEILLPATMFVHLLMAPYTKVEESFNIQAIHDVANIGMPVPFTNVEEVLAQYDHVEFPGVVPRSFAGAGLIGGITSMVLGFVQDGLLQQIIVRAFLGLLNCSTIVLLSRRAASAYSPGAAKWYLLLQASQFHVMYYVSRTLPNMLAFGLVTYALAELLPPPRSLAARKDWFDTSPIGLQVLVLAAVIFRCELGILFLTSVVPLLATGWVNIFELVILGGATGLLGVLTAVSVDTYFWQTFPKPMWAELEGFLFNTVQGRSAEWGTSPVYYYFVNAIPKMMLNPLALLVLLPIGIYAGGWKRTTERIVGPSIAFVGVYSLLPHKEWRFIVYIMPALTLVAGVGADWVFSQRRKGVLYLGLNLALFTTVALTFVASFGMSYVSSLNYPGGQALRVLEEVAGGREDLRIHMDVLTCMTGATRFTQNTVGHPGWKFSKEERKEVLANPGFWREMDYLLTSNPEYVLGLFPDWEVKKAVKGYDGVAIWKEGSKLEEADILLGGKQAAEKLVGVTKAWPVVKMRDQVWIVGRKKVDIHLPGFEDVDLNDFKETVKLHDEL
ncbi:dolichyl-P-Man:Man(7)GlcNAc(2)-PP-dolichol alpha-1,6-mannosyltransferase [Orbilia oligospora]|uniref:Mannosyltransferase n=1 Tax=Orbilia oligospora TaxID=2813651 RepID=A0A7C8JC39_ORBOL|nr:dolichyl-P-Man:Man(7)GlcNAc(2)-PP-dolichol alpha-1,6-mannosyltransferase [Orbilia oligospora]KAF3114144.1 dolichyl-P-Man:Man(7)GlcNAc(2)-PP-dolichol alpha-1,6-mannosyltransferase [Orbilia oligospora]